MQFIITVCALLLLQVIIIKSDDYPEWQQAEQEPPQELQDLSESLGSNTPESEDSEEISLDETPPEEIAPEENSPDENAPDGDASEVRGIIDKITNSNIVLALDDMVDEIIDGAVEQLKEKASIKNESENVKSEENYRRKRDLISSAFGTIQDSLSQATTDLTSLMQKQTEKAPDLSSLTNAGPIPNVMVMPKTVIDLIETGKEIYGDVSKSVSEISSTANDLMEASESNLLPTKLVAARKAEQTIRREIKKAKDAFAFANDTLKKLQEKSDTGEFTSQCMNTITNLPDLLSDGRKCLMDKYNKGYEIVNSTMEKFITASRNS
uniref:Lol56.6 n=1 Tax=Bichromomyia olmeca TaxID=715919 RepID=A0A1B1V3I3_9DIPT|nr:Lol56.6 [Bichromomyia olmeca]